MTTTTTTRDARELRYVTLRFTTSQRAQTSIDNFLFVSLLAPFSLSLPPRTSFYLSFGSSFFLSFFLSFFFLLLSFLQLAAIQFNLIYCCLLSPSVRFGKEKQRSVVRSFVRSSSEKLLAGATSRVNRASWSSVFVIVAAQQTPHLAPFLSSSLCIRQLISDLIILYILAASCPYWSLFCAERSCASACGCLFNWFRRHKEEGV